MNKDRVAILIDKLDKLRVRAAIPGLAIALVHNARDPFLAGLGYANLKRRQAVTPHTPFRIASLTKPLAATLALRLQQDGVLDIHDAMSTFAGFAAFCAQVKHSQSVFFKEWQGDHPELTLQHLLSMTANGIPGARFFYNPVAFSWASRPMAERAGVSFSDLIQAHIFAPAGMHSSARVHRDLSLRPDLAATLARPYRTEATGRAVESSPPQPQGDGAGGGTIATAADLAAFDMALDQGKLISAAARQQMWTPPAPHIPYGLGWYVKHFRGEQLVWHTGLWEDRYSALYVKVLTKRWSMILLANSDGLKWPGRLDEANIEDSLFAQALLDWLDKQPKL